MAQDKAVEIVSQFAEHMNAGDFDALAGLFADDAKVEMPTRPEPLDVASYVGTLRAIRAAFPDWSLDVADVIAQGELVAVRGTHAATFDGAPFMGLEPNGRSFSGPVHPIFKVADGKIQNMWGLFDTLGFMAFAGAVEPPKLERPPSASN